MDVDNITSERMSLRAKGRPDQETLATLAGDHGPLNAGALPAADSAHPDGEKSLWEAMTKRDVAKPKPRPKEKDPAAEVVVPKTLKETLGFCTGTLFSPFSQKKKVPQACPLCFISH